MPRPSAAWAGRRQTPLAPLTPPTPLPRPPHAASSSRTVTLRPSADAIFTSASSENRAIRPRSRSLMRGCVTPFLSPCTKSRFADHSAHPEHNALMEILHARPAAICTVSSVRDVPGLYPHHEPHPPPLIHRSLFDKNSLTDSMKSMLYINKLRYSLVNRAGSFDRFWGHF